ncbi:hypothetical protein EVAR_16536_1 [Eumeta japonica]|uniref:Uncharacterized protein n=1 Tax=Eumeta variegata TaxID=151549 RepID=A0A4C1U2R2_EUMVA|nr:hypothetical protein EVAR_16536_1 [Eumeta japonica]
MNELNSHGDDDDDLTPRTTRSLQRSKGRQLSHVRRSLHPYLHIANAHADNVVLSSALSEAHGYAASPRNQISLNPILRASVPTVELDLDLVLNYDSCLTIGSKTCFTFSTNINLNLDTNIDSALGLGDPVFALDFIPLKTISQDRITRQAAAGARPARRRALSPYEFIIRRAAAAAPGARSALAERSVWSDTALASRTTDICMHMSGR